MLAKEIAVKDNRRIKSSIKSKLLIKIKKLSLFTHMNLTENSQLARMV